MDRLWDSWNQGVRHAVDPIAACLGLVLTLLSHQRQWKDIRHKYVEGAEDEE